MKYEEQTTVWACDDCGVNHFYEVKECEECLSPEIVTGDQYKSKHDMINSRDMAFRLGVIEQ